MRVDREVSIVLRKEREYSQFAIGWLKEGYCSAVILYRKTHPCVARMRPRGRGGG